MRKPIILACLAATTAVGLVGCSSIPLQPNANKVMVTNDQNHKGCKFVGTATSNQGNFFTGGFTSNQNLQEGAFNDLRNQAANMGGNRVILLMSTAASTGSGGVVNGTGSYGSQETNVALTGNVFSCPNQ